MINIKQKTFSGIRWTTTSMIVSNVFGIVQISILARLLDRSDFGLLAMAMVVIGFAQIFIDVGISNAIIYYKEITKQQLSTLYWLNIIVGLFLFLILIGTAPLVSRFYHEPKLTEVIFYVSLSYLIIPFGQQYQTILTKELQFKLLAKIEIISKFISFVISILFALLHFGVYSLIIGNLSSVFISTVLLMGTGRKVYKPIFYFNLKGIKKYLNFGIFQMGEKIINVIGYQLDSILIGKLLGSEALGLYSLIKNLSLRASQIIIPVITKVTFPLMAITENNATVLKQYYLKTIQYITIILLPVNVLMLIFPEAILNIFYGSKWISGAFIFQIFSIYTLVRSISSPTGNLLLAKGKAKFGFYWNIFFVAILVFSIFIGSSWNLIGIAFALLILHIIILIPEWKFIIQKNCQARFLEYFGNIVTPIVIAIPPTVLSLTAYFIFHNKIEIFILGTSIFMVSYFLLIFKFQKAFLNHLMQLIPVTIFDKYHGYFKK